MVNDEAPDLETLVENSNNPYAVRQYIRMGDELSAQRAEIARLTRERDEAIEVAVWAAKHHASLYHDDPVKHINYWVHERQKGQGEIETDGTDAGIYAALREAMGGDYGARS